MKKILKNKKGFTLVELLVATAILGMVSLTVLGLMTTGSNMFSSVQKRTMTMFKSQSASVQLKSYIQNCNGCIAYNPDGNVLLLTDKENIYEIVYSSSEKMLILCKIPSSEIDASGNISEELEDALTSGNEYIAPLSYNVSGVDYTIYTDDNGYATAVKFDLTITRLGHEYTRSQTVAFRSQVKCLDINDDNALNEIIKHFGIS